MEEKSMNDLCIHFRRATSQDEYDVLALGSYYQGLDSISYEFGKLIKNPFTVCTVCLSGDKIVAFDCAIVSKCQTFVSYCHARTHENFRKFGIFGSLRRFTMLNVRMKYQNIAEIGFITQSVDLWENLIKTKKKPGRIQAIIIDKIPHCIAVKMQFSDHCAIVEKIAKFKSNENMIFKIILIIILVGLLKFARSLVISNLKDKWVLITGCDRGFGKITALQLNDMNVGVIGCCLTKEGADFLNNKGIKAICLDVTNEESINNCFEDVVKIIGEDKGLWAIINNAGIATVCGPTEWLNGDDFRKLFEVNTLGVINMTIKLLPLIKKAKGRVVNMASMLGRCGQPYVGPYVVSKFAVEGFTDSLRREMAIWNVSVHTIEPGYFLTNIVDFEKYAYKQFNIQPKEMQEMYGRDFLEDWIQSGRQFIKDNCKSDLSPVINAYVHATTAKFPKSRYVVGGDAKFLTFLASHLPDFVLDAVYEKILKRDGRIKPKAVRE
ncbi:DgyrCDS10689 [Dimorphilus gyrociliatus]|uniref:DgyrCDS10689 n=1 Tax=Dimorphilus gyrociliatus TaxID=2664684 RepID=A0A7I8W103_9ANNE|nr:DgyrCDS10689 [Dimorphilus gyrociliatus]